MRLPIQIEVIVFRRRENNLEFLLLKRIESRGNFWQFITGGLEDFDKSELDCAKREFEEETKLSSSLIKKIVLNLAPFDFEHKGKRIEEKIFGFEVDNNSKIGIDSEEHSKFIWCSFEKANNLLKFENNKKALKLLVSKI